jgi:Ca2+-binding EF-hand superfamily protein
VKQIIEVLTTMGHKMKKSDALELIDVVGIQPNGKVEYAAMINAIHEKVPAEDAKPEGDEEEKGGQGTIMG